LTGKLEKAPPLELSNRISAALRLHKLINTAIVKQDAGTIKQRACAGLSAKLRTRIATRQQQKLPPVSWRLVKYNGLLLPGGFLANIFNPKKAAKVVAEQLVPLPLGGKDATIRQAVVKIKSRQEYDKGDGKGQRVKDLTEYVVVQKMTGDGMERDWMMWGTVEPSTVKEIETMIEAEKLQSGSSLLSRFKNLMPMGGG
jgi:hypothetical protein